MTVQRLIARLSLLTIIFIVIGTVIVLFARTTFSPSAPAEGYTGTLTGSVTGVSPKARFMITATGLFSNNLTTYSTSTLTGPGAYTFTNIAAGDLFGAGYADSVVSYTVSVAPLAPCYSVTPVSRTAAMPPNGFVDGVDFTAAWVRPAVTVNVRMTEVIVMPGQAPTNPVIVSPNRSNGTANLENIVYRIQGPGGVNQQSAPVGSANGPSYSTLYTFTNSNANLMAVEPSSGNCSEVYTVSVYSVSPQYRGVVSWTLVPSPAVQTVTISTNNPVVEVGFLAYVYRTWSPVVVK